MTQGFLCPSLKLGCKLLACLSATLLFVVPARPDTSITTYLNGSENIVYLGTNQHVYELVFTAGQPWTSVDITSSTSTPVAIAGSPLVSFVQNGVVAVLFIGSNQHIYEAVYTGSWSSVDVTAAASAPVAATTSGLTTYVNGAQGFVFQGVNQHIYQVVFSGAGWGSEDITVASGAPAAMTGTALSSFVQGSATGVAFIASNQHVYEVAFVQGSWGNVDVTASAGLPAAQGSRVSAFQDGVQNFVYEGANQHIYQAVFNGTWSGGDVTAASGAPNAEANSSIATYVLGNTVGVVFLGANQHVYESAFIGGTWNYADITAATSLPAADTGSALSFFYDGDQHFVFQDPSGYIYQGFFTGSWGGENVTLAAMGPLA